MSLKKLGIVLASASFAGALAFGCSSTTSSTSSGGTGDDGGVGTSDAKPDVKVAPDSSSGGTDSQPPTCVALTTVTGFTAKWVPPAAHQNACTQQNIDQFKSLCLGTTADTAGCNSFLGTAAGKTCAACLSTADTASAYGPLIEHQAQGTVELNTAGCVALATGDSSATSCGSKLLADTECANAACVNCPQVSDQASLDQLNQCTSDAEQGACATYASGASCADGLAEAGNAAVAKCVGGSNFDDGYAQIAPLFCLTTGATDSGGGG